MKPSGAALLEAARFLGGFRVATGRFTDFTFDFDAFGFFFGFAGMNSVSGERRGDQEPRSSYVRGFEMMRFSSTGDSAGEKAL